MLYIVLILVVVALGLLVTALITAHSLWAWISIGLSVLAALILLIDWLRRRRARSTPQPESDESAEQDVAEDDDDATLAPAGEALLTGSDGDEQGAESPAEQTTMMPAAGDLAGASAAGASDSEGASEANSEYDENGDPAQEQTEAADLRIVSRLDAEVLVVDEYPRYHLEDCDWVGERETIPLAVSEARELGFSPCARCGPDAKLAAQYGKRSKRKSRSQR